MWRVQGDPWSGRVDVSMNRQNERRVTIVDRSGGWVDQTVAGHSGLVETFFVHHRD
jgi:hypothetical protein